MEVPGTVEEIPEIVEPLLVPTGTVPFFRHAALNSVQSLGFVPLMVSPIEYVVPSLRIEYASLVVSTHVDALPVVGNVTEVTLSTVAGLIAKVKLPLTSLQVRFTMLRSDAPGVTTQSLGSELGTCEG
jgi:hypothetical protein